VWGGVSLFTLLLIGCIQTRTFVQSSMRQFVLIRLYKLLLRFVKWLCLFLSSR
jgi:hypothetical protein